MEPETTIEFNDHYCFGGIPKPGKKKVALMKFSLRIEKKTSDSTTFGMDWWGAQSSHLDEKIEKSGSIRSRPLVHDTSGEFLSN